MAAILWEWTKTKNTLRCQMSNLFWWLSWNEPSMLNCLKFKEQIGRKEKKASHNFKLSHFSFFPTDGTKGTRLLWKAVYTTNLNCSKIAPFIHQILCAENVNILVSVDTGKGVYCNPTILEKALKNLRFFFLNPGPQVHVWPWVCNAMQTNQ